MNTENIGSIIKWIVVIIAIIVVSSFFSIVISDYTDIDPVLMSLFLSGLSISLGGISLHLGSKSDRKVNSIANADFQRVIGQIEDLRLELKSEELTRDKKGKIVLAPKLITKRAIYSWKCVTYIREANTLLRETKIISPFYIKRYFNLFNKYLEQIKEVKELLICEEVHHLLIMFKRMYDIKLEKFLNDKTLEEVEYDIKIENANDFLREILDNINIEFNKDSLEAYDSVMKSYFKDNDKIRWSLYTKYKPKFIEEYQKEYKK